MHSRSLSIVASTILLSFAFALHAQNQPAFIPGQKVPVAMNPGIFLSADFNNDGFVDVLMGQGPFDDFTLAVFLNNGDGTYRGPIAVPGIQNPRMVTFGDFNQDGNLDLAVVPEIGIPTTPGNGAVTILFGDGQGNFGNQQTYDVVGHPSAITAGDFNNDGLMDLAVTGFVSKTITILTNTGGAFSSSSFTVPISFDARTDLLRDIVAGDFNGDGKMDLIYMDSCGTACSADQDNFHLLTNTGGGFVPTLLSQAGTGTGRLHSIDIDGDGRSDFYFVFSGCFTTCTGIDIFYSNGDGSFLEQDVFSDNALTNGGDPTDIVVADFNNDGIMDLATSSSPTTTVHNPGIDIYPGKGGHSNFSTFFHFDSPSGHDARPVGIATGFVDGDGAKDILLDEDSDFIPFFNNSSFDQDPCPYPASPGLNFCVPSDGGSASSPVHIVGSFHAQTQPANRIELWIDGNKMFQVFNDRIDTTVPLSAGAHEATLVGVSATGQFIKSTNSFTVGGGSCPVPGSPGVSICTPAPDSTVNSPVHISAAAAPNPGVVITAMRTYIDNQEAKTVTGNTISADLNLPSGNHFLAVVAWDNTGGSYISTENITVHGSSAPCLPQSAGARICTPSDGATVSSPVEVSAGAIPSAGRITAIRVYIDDNAVLTSLNNSSSNSFAIDAGIAMAAGEHHLVIVAYQDDGSALVAGETINVQ